MLREGETNYQPALPTLTIFEGWRTLRGNLGIIRWVLPLLLLEKGVDKHHISAQVIVQ